MVKTFLYFCIYNFFVCSMILLCSRTRVILCEEMSFFNEIKGEGIRSYSIVDIFTNGWNFYIFLNFKRHGGLGR